MESNLSTRAKTWLGISAIPIILYSIIPILWMLSLSLKPSSDLADGNFIPSQISWSNYSLILTGGAKDLFLPALANSIVVCLSATVISVVLATFAAYAIARLDFPGKKLILTTALAVSIFPVISLVTPIYNLWRPRPFDPNSIHAEE